MLAYKFTTQISRDGKIIVPDYLKKFYASPVEVIMLLPEKKSKSNIALFYDLIAQYNQIDEPELDMNELTIIPSIT
jgi:hypothetical protein